MKKYKKKLLTALGFEGAFLALWCATWGMSGEVIYGAKSQQLGMRGVVDSGCPVSPLYWIAQSFRENWIIFLTISICMMALGFWTAKKDEKFSVVHKEESL